MPAPVPGAATPPAGAAPSPSDLKAPASTPPTNSQQAQPTSGAGVPPEELERARKIIEAQAAVIRDNTNATARLQQEFRELREKFTAPPQAPEPSSAEKDKDFWTNPSAALDRRDKSLLDTITREMRETVAPLLQSTKEVKVASVVEQEKARLKREYGEAEFAKMEPIVDEFFDKAAAARIEVTPELTNIAGSSAYGILAREGAFNKPPVTTQSSSTDKKVDAPPYMPPSAPVIPGHEPEKTARRSLTENEERLRRERGFTVDQYLDWIEVKPEQVVKSQIGKAAQ